MIILIIQLIFLKDLSITNNIFLIYFLHNCLWNFVVLTLKVSVWIWKVWEVMEINHNSKVLNAKCFWPRWLWQDNAIISSLSSCFRHGAAVHCGLSGNMWPLWKAVHMGREVVGDGQECTGCLSDNPGHFGSSHDSRRTSQWKQTDSREDFSLCQTPAR